MKLRAYLMKIKILTLFPRMFEGIFSESIIKRALESSSLIDKIRATIKAIRATAPIPITKTNEYNKQIIKVNKSKSKISILITKSTKNITATAKQEKKLTPTASKNNLHRCSPNKEIILSDTKSEKKLSI